MADVEADAAKAVDEIRRRQEARDEAEKAKEFDEMRKKNEKTIEDSRKANERLSNAKTAPERIRLRRESEDRLRRENIRTDKINAGWKEPKTPEEREIETNKQKMITTENMKRGAQEIISKAPSYFDRAISGIFSPVVETSTHKPKVSASKGIVQESRQFNKAIASHAKKPVTGGKVQKGMIDQPVSINQNFMDNILGGVPEATIGKKSTKPSVKRNSMSGLDDFVRRL
jgi:hypothetical protein